MTRHVLFHSHGMGPFDFSTMTPRDLVPLNEFARQAQLLVCPTMFVRRTGLTHLSALMQEYADLRSRGFLDHIVGFGLEGPFIGNEGGSPSDTCWQPALREWDQLISNARYGLCYMVLSPDLVALETSVCPDASLEEVISKCYDAGIRIALGHFRVDNPNESAARTIDVINYLHETYVSSPLLVLTDHIFNDMPRSFRHAWRDPRDRTSRQGELDRVLSAKWNAESLPEILGPVPAVLLNAAQEGLATIAMNLDGDHVDKDICKAVIDYLGANRVIAMSDNTDLPHLAGDQLAASTNNTLLYRQDGRVAAGSVDLNGQLENARQMGLDSEAIETMFATLPAQALGFRPRRRT